MPVITVEMFSGRTTEQKRDLAKVLTEGYVAVCGGKPESVHIIFHDVDRANWSVGGKLCAPQPDSDSAVSGNKEES